MSSQQQIDQIIKTAAHHHQSGDLSKAETLYKQILAISPNNVDANNLMGVLAGQNGQHETAINYIRKAIKSAPNIAMLHYNLGSTLKELNRSKQAISSFKKALSINPNYSEAANNLGMTLQDIGATDQAIESFHNSISINPHNLEAHYNLGCILQESNKPEKAISHYQKALSLNDNHSRAHNNIGATLAATGNPKQAEDHFKKATLIDPTFIDAINNLGLALQRRGQYRQAINQHRKALALQPNNIESLCHLSDGLSHLNEKDEAACHLIQVLNIDPKHTGAMISLSNILKGRTLSIKSDEENEELRKIVKNCFNNKAINHQNISDLALGIILNKKTKEEIKSLKTINPYATNFNINKDTPNIKSLLKNEIFISILTLTVVTNPLIESLLIFVRSYIAHCSISDKNKLQDLNTITLAIAHQCHWNEYIYTENYQDTKAIVELTENLAAEKEKTTIGLFLSAITCFKPISTLENKDNLYKTIKKSKNKYLLKLFDLQIKNPKKEKDLSKSIELLSAIENTVSTEVKSLYESNPYPRWINYHQLSPNPTEEILKQQIWPNKLTEETSRLTKPEVLIAGCGTGKQSASSAQAYLNSKVLAIDISLSSLSYAKRKTNEFNIKNIDFIQADILAAEKLEKHFDIIECGGVLHHMEDPKVGWKILTNILNPGGYMKIALYSETARRGVASARNFIEEQGFKPTPDGIRKCRQAIMHLADEHPAKSVAKGQDFYSMSSTRDLLFHVQEHLFNLPLIEKILSELNLEFLGMITNSDIKQDYLSTFPEDPCALSLDNWHKYEQDNPNTFFAMYQFWLRKKA